MGEGGGGGGLKGDIRLELEVFIGIIVTASNLTIIACYFVSYSFSLFFSLNFNIVLYLSIRYGMGKTALGGLGFQHPLSSSYCAKTYSSDALISLNVSLYIY